MVEEKLEFSQRFNQSMIEEIDSMTRSNEEKQGLLVDKYIELHQRIKAKSARVER